MLNGYEHTIKVIIRGVITIISIVFAAVLLDIRADVKILLIDNAVAKEQRQNMIINAAKQDKEIDEHKKWAEKNFEQIKNKIGN